MGRTEQAVSQITDAGTWMLKDKRSTGKLSCKSFQIQTLNIVIVLVAANRHPAWDSQSNLFFFQWQDLAFIKIQGRNGAKDKVQIIV